MELWGEGKWKNMGGSWLGVWFCFCPGSLPKKLLNQSPSEAPHPKHIGGVDFDDFGALGGS